MIINQLKKKYTVHQLFESFYKGYLSIPTLIRNRRNKTVDSKFIERLMLATTEVNGCEVCSYAHTHMALREGFSQDEINAFLSGSKAFVNEDEGIAILYAQHVADTMGYPTPDSFQRLKEVYGEDKAEIIRAAVTVMMMGNVSGIPLSAFLRRIQGKPYTNSSLLYESGMLLIQPLLMVMAIPVALMKILTSHLLKKTKQSL
jgi:AhpD family alkylhydroperoxidase